MVRNYKKKRESDVNEDDVKKAVLCVVNDGYKLRTAASIYNIKHTTLFYRIKKYKENAIPRNEQFSSKHTVNQVFDNCEEGMLEDYFLKRSRMHYGLTYLQGRQLAYEYATALKKCPEKWTANKMAGTDWMKGFMKRHKVLSLRKPENTSLSRSTSFNRHNVNLFFDNYEKVLEKGTFTPDRIYNLDETNIMTVVQSPNVIAKTGQKQVGQCVSAERGQLITMCAIVNALGNTIPPVFVFPRARFHDSMLFGAPAGSLGLANNPKSGWMTGPLFLKVLQHIQKATRCSIADKILILMDNHESHCTIDAINYCRDNGIVLLTFPPHCTHKMQPLDVAVNASFKAKLAVAQNDWLVNHPGKTITIHDLAGIVTPAYNASHTINNITSGFATPGIYPFSRNAFTEDDFQCSEVTNRDNENTASASSDFQNRAQLLSDSVDVLQPVNDRDDDAEQAVDIVQPVIDTADGAEQAFDMAQPVIDTADDVEQAAHQSYSVASDLHQSQAPDYHHSMNLDSDVTDAESVDAENPMSDTVALLTPEAVRPLPKAAPRKLMTKRKKASSRILTDTPEKNNIEAAHLERLKRLNKSSIRPFGKRGKKGNNKDTKVRKTTVKSKKNKKRTESSTDSDQNISVHDDSDMEVSDDQLDIDFDNVMGEEIIPHPLTKNDLKVDDYLLVACQSAYQKANKHFVGIVQAKDNNIFTVSFMKKKTGCKFFFPDKEDKWSVPIVDVVAKLPTPQNFPGTSRTASLFWFKFDFSKFNLG